MDSIEWCRRYDDICEEATRQVDDELGDEWLTEMYRECMDGGSVMYDRYNALASKREQELLNEAGMFLDSGG